MSDSGKKFRRVPRDEARHAERARMSSRDLDAKAEELRPLTSDEILGTIVPEEWGVDDERERK